MAIVDPDLTDIQSPPPREPPPPSEIKDPDLQDLHPAAPKPEGGAFEVPTRLMGHVNKGLAKVPGIALDPLKMVAGYAGLEDYVPGSQDIEQLLKSLGMIHPISDKKAETIPGQMADAAAELGGEAVGFGGPLRAGLRYLGEKAVNPVARAVMKEVGGTGTLGSEAKNVALDAGLGALSGGTGEVAAQQAGEKFRPWGELTGALAPMAALAPLQWLGRKIMPPLGREAQDRAAAELLDPRLADPKDTTRDMLGLRLGHAQREAADLPGYTPTTGAVLDDPTILGQERALITTDPAAREEVKRLRGQNQAAMQEGLDDAAPAGDPNAPRRAASERVQAFRDKVKARRDQLTQRAQADAAARTGQAQGQLDEATVAFQESQRALDDAHVTVDRTPEQASRAVAEHLTAAERQADTRAKELFDQVDKTAEVTIYPLRQARDEVHAQAKERGREDAIPAILKAPKDDEGKQFGKFLDDYLNPPADQPPGKKFLPKLPVAQLQGLRSRLTTARRQLRESGGDEQEMAFLSRLIQGVDDTLEQAPEQAVSGPYKIARDFFRENVAGPFRDNTVGKIIKGDVPPTEAAGQLFKPGERGATSADEFIRAAGGEAPAQELVRDYAVQKALAYAVDRQGRVDPAKLRTFNQKYAPALDRFPTVQQELADLQAMQTAARESAAQAQARVASAEDQVSQVGRSSAQAVREAEARGARLGRRGEAAIQNQHAAMVLDSDPAKLITQIRNSKDPAETLTKISQLVKKDPQAQAGLARAYWDTLMQRVAGSTEGSPIVPSKLARLTSDPREVALQNALLTPAQRYRLSQVLKAAQTEQRAVQAKATRGGSDTAENYSGQRLMEHGMRAVLGGPIGSGIAGLLKAMGMAATKESVQSIYREAILDPQAMSALLGRLNRQGMPEPKAYQQLLNLQARLRPDPYPDPDKEK